MTQTIEQLQSRVAELEKYGATRADEMLAASNRVAELEAENLELKSSRKRLAQIERITELEAENARLKEGGDIPIGWVSGNKLSACIESKLEFHAKIKELRQQLAAAQADSKRLRDALEVLAKLGNGNQYGNSEGNRIAQQALATKIGTSALDQLLAVHQLEISRLRDALIDIQQVACSGSPELGIASEALAHPTDTSALDAFVAEKVKEYQERLSEALGLLGADTQFEAEFAVRNYNQQISELTRQRDLAVEALGNAFGFCEAYATQSETARFCVKQLGDALSAIRESEAKPCE